jgi:hypothetical protein
MSRSIIAVQELYTDGVINLGASLRNVNFHMKVILEDQSAEWHYYGTPLPAIEQRQPGIPYFEYPSVRFPLDIYNLEDANGSLYMLAFEVAMRLLII